MNYRQSISYLFGLQRFGIKLGLSNIQTLLKQLDNPHKKIRYVHIAGTNGKGSTAAFLLSVFREAGYRTGLFTSPHLIDFTERIKINDREISRGRTVELVQLIKDMCTRADLESITFFEFVTAMALTYFSEEQVDMAIIEVGMGGRLDATNVIQPLVSIITSVSLEHQVYLGNTLAQIAGEKAGIIKKKTPLVTAVTQPHLKGLIEIKCRHSCAPLYIVGNDITCKKTGHLQFNYTGLKRIIKGINSGLIGDYQIRNATLALAAAEILCEKGYSLSAEHMRNGIKKVHWPGRMEVVKKNPTVILDGAHNTDAWKKLRQTITDYFRYKKLIMVIGIMADKDISHMIEILTPEAHTVIFCKPKMDRAATKGLIERCIQLGIKNKVLWIDETAAAVDRALQIAEQNDLICITGSLFTVGEAREYCLPQRGIPSGRIPL